MFNKKEITIFVVSAIVLSVVLFFFKSPLSTENTFESENQGYQSDTAEVEYTGEWLNDYSFDSNQIADNSLVSYEDKYFSVKYPSELSEWMYQGPSGDGFFQVNSALSPEDEANSEAYANFFVQVTNLQEGFEELTDYIGETTSEKKYILIQIGGREYVLEERLDTSRYSHHDILLRTIENDKLYLLSIVVQGQNEDALNKAFEEFKPMFDVMVRSFEIE